MNTSYQLQYLSPNNTYFELLEHVVLFVLLVYTCIALTHSYDNQYYMWFLFTLVSLFDVYIVTYINKPRNHLGFPSYSLDSDLEQ